MTTVHSHDIRVLLCNHCGAPLDAPTTGGTATCSYCGAANVVTVRDERAELAAAQSGPQLDEAVRFDRLRNQASAPMEPPASLRSYLVAGKLPHQYVDHALAEWRQTRDEVQAGGDYPSQERLYFLAVLLAGSFLRQRDEQRRRGVIESTLELLPSARHRQMLRGMLSRDAARAGDLQAAEDWLAPIEPYSDDIYVDSSYRISKAYLATVRGDWDQVVGLLGSSPEERPVAVTLADLAAVLRANAIERQGNVAAAAASLRAAGVDESTANEVRSDHDGLAFCPKSVAAPHSQEPRKDTSLGAYVFFLGLPGGLAVTAYLFPEARLPLLAIAGGALSLVAIVIILYFVVLPGPTRVGGKGLDGVAHVLDVRRMKVRVDGDRLVDVRCRVFLDDREPYEAQFKAAASEDEISRLESGASVAVKVHPDRPERVAHVKGS